MGCPDQSLGSQLSRGPTRRLSHFTPSHTGRSAWAMAVIPPGGQSSCGSTRWSTRSQLQGRQSNRGPTRWLPGMQRALIKFLQVVRSSDGLDFPWVAVPAASLRGGPPGNGNSQARGRQHPSGSTRWRPICIKPSSSLAIRVGRPCDGLGDYSGRSAQLQDAVGHPGSSSSDSRPAAAPRVGGLSEWPDHHGTAESEQTTRGHLGSSGGQLSCGTQCATRARQAASPAAGLRGGGLSEWPASQRAMRGHSELSDGQSGCGHEAGPAGGGTDSVKLRRSGAAAGRVDGQCPAGPHQSESDLEHPPGRVCRGTSALLAGRGIDAPGPGRRSRFSGGSSTSTAAARGPHEMANQDRRPRVPTAPAVPETSSDLGGHPGSCDPHIVYRHSTPTSLCLC